jgi:threonine dehydrogenase-like Zn-dependent dehydrogenase
MPPPTDVSDQTHQGLGKVTLAAKHDETRKMLGAEWTGKTSVTVNERSVPMLTDPQDAIIKVTSTAICGSDLHMYVGAMPGMTKGDLMGHEFMGIVEAVGPEVKNFSVGDRVVCCFDLGCGSCMYCKKNLHSSCDVTNPSKEQEYLYGHRTGGIHGYSMLTGGWEGGQAEYARVVFADTNLLKIPKENPDEKYLYLSDILPTAWHANVLANTGDGDVVAIWGAGPVGMLAAQCAFARGASRVISIDSVAYRLERVKEVAPGVETINFSEGKTLDQLKKLVPNGPDCVIEAVGFHYSSSLLHTIEMKLMMETDPSAIINELIYAVRKGGRIGVVGVYAGFCNHFNIGALMEKGLRMAAGQTPCQAYWHDLLDMIESGKLKPDTVTSHVMPLSAAAQGYKMFNDKNETDRCVKVVLKPGGTDETVIGSVAESLNKLTA